MSARVPFLTPPPDLEHEGDVPGARPMLSRRERQVAAWVLRGCRNEDIADALAITRSTVESHGVHIRERLAIDHGGYLGPRDFALSLLAYAIERDPGLIDGDSEIGRALALLASRREEVSREKDLVGPA